MCSLLQGMEHVENEESDCQQHTDKNHVQAEIPCRPHLQSHSVYLKLCSILILVLLRLVSRIQLFGHAAHMHALQCAREKCSHTVNFFPIKHGSALT